MQLTVLGCAGTYPGPDSACSSYLVEADGFRLLLDVGTGSLGALQRCRGIFAVDAVLLSHLHADHCLDLVAYTYARRYHPDGPQPALPVYGPAGTQDRLCRAFDTDPADRLEETYLFRTAAAPATLSIGPFAVALAKAAHPVEASVITVTHDGRSLTYSGDTGPSAALVEAARDTDLFLCEASWLDGPDHPAGVHLTAREAGEHATAAGARRLLLTHLVAWGDEARTVKEASAAYAGPLELARAGTTYDV